MKKTNLTTAVVAGLVGAAGLVNVSNAVNLNPDGVGQVLIYPYYTIENGLVTAVSVVNTTDEVKAVKVRFLEGRNSQEVLDFNLYMSPFDVWTGVVTEAIDGSGAGRLVTSDTSCTVPAIPADGLRFQNFEYALRATTKDVGPFGLDRTRAGHLEMIEMGSVIDPQLANAATHVGGSATAPAVPSNCQALVDAWRVVNGVEGFWVDSAFANPELRGIASPNGGLFGGALLVDVAEGTSLSYNADALQGFYTLSGAGLNLHSNPGDTFPSLAQANNGLGLATAVIFDPNTPSQVVTLDFVTGTPNAVTAVYMHNEIYNEYAVGGSASISSEWVITHPTKRLHIRQATVEGRRPFTDTYRLGTGTTVRGACEPIRVAFWDREERDSRSTQGSSNVCPSPLPPEGCNPESEVPGTNLCWEANVFSFNQLARRTAGEPSAILGATYYENFETAPVFGPDGLPATDERFGAGWARLNFFVQDADQAPGISIHRMLSLPEAGGVNMVEGLPVTGFYALKATNANAAPGLLAQYAGLFHHRGDRVGYTVQVDVDGVIDPQGFEFLWS